MNLVPDFLNNLYFYLSGNKQLCEKSNIIRKHGDKLQSAGDFSFPLDEKVWKNFMIFDDSFQKKVELLVEHTSDWDLPIVQTKIENNRCLIFLNRTKLFGDVISSVECELNNWEVGVSKYSNAQNKRIICLTTDVLDEEELLVTELRLELIKNCLCNLSKYTNIEIVETNEGDNIPHLHLTTNLNKKIEISDEKMLKKILCGNAYNPGDPDNKRKKSKMTANEYIKKRSVDMQLMAQHKYGLRVKNEKIFIDLIATLGVAAVTVDLLEVKHSSPVGLSTICGQSSSKGASFILYNSARLETLFRTFDERIKSGYYPSLPSIDQIDFGLLREDDEWQLLFNYVLEFSALIEKSIGNLERGEIHVHLICGFLSGFVGVFSVYYRRTRILTENRPQLIPVMQARFYLLRILRVIFNKTLKLLNISPVNQM